MPATPAPEENVDAPDPTPTVEAAAEEPAAPPPPLPEARQCQIVGHNEYGNVAVKGAGQMAAYWMVGSPENGGHWNTDAQVADWKVLS